MAVIVGYVKNMDGKYFAKDEKGNIRELKEGDPIYENDVVFGDETNAGDANIEIALWDGAKQLVLAGNDPLNVDTALLRAVLLDDESSVNVEEIRNMMESLKEYTTPQKMIIDQGETQKNPTQNNQKPIDPSVSVNDNVTKNPVEAPTHEITDVKEKVWIDPFEETNISNVEDMGGTNQNSVISSKKGSAALQGDTNVSEGENASYEVIFQAGSIPMGEILVTLEVTNNNSESSDYSFTNTVISITPNSSGKYIFTIPTIDDSVYEGDESYSVKLINVRGGGFDTIETSGTLVTTHILDDGTGSVPGGGTPDDDRPSMSIGDVTIEEGSNAVFAVTVSAAETPYTVTFNTSTNGSAEAGDITTPIIVKDSLGNTISANLDGSYTVPAGETTLSVEVPTTDDNIYEGAETFELNGRTEFMSSDVSGTGTITDTITDNVSTNEDTPLTLTINDFGSYGDSDPLVSIKIIALPASGVLTLDGNVVSANDVISVLDINANKLVFTPESQSDADVTIDFQVSDGSGFSTTSTTTVNVIAVADAPTVNVSVSAYTGTFISNTANIVTTTSIPDNTDSTQTVIAINGVKYAMSFNYLDMGMPDTASGQLKVYWGGELVATIDGNNTMSQTATLELIGGSGDGSNSLRFEQSGTTSDSHGIVVDTIMMAPMENMLQYNVDISGALGLDNSDGSEILSVTLSGMPADATLEIGSAGSTAGTWVIPVSGTSINLTDIKMYVPESADTFTLTATSRATETNDNGSGNNYEETSANPTVTDVSLDAAPTSTNDTIIATEDTTYVFTVNDFGTYADDGGSGTFNGVMITSLPTNGTLHLLGHDASIVGGVPQDFVTVGTVVTLKDLELGNLVFVPNDNYSGGSNTFEFRVSDGRSWSASSYTNTIGVTAVADVPTVAINIGTATLSSGSDMDTFATNLEGWSGTSITRVTSGSYSNTMQIPMDKTATKEFDFGVANAGQVVIVSYNVYAIGGMESSGTIDSLTLSQTNTVSNSTTTIATYTDASWNTSTDTTRTLNYNATVDANGKVKLNLVSNTSTSEEIFYIDDVSVSLPSTTDYPITITNALGVDTDGSESLSSVTLSGIPTDALLYANGVSVTVTSGSANLTQAQISAGNIVLKIPSTDSQTFTLDVTVNSVESSNNDSASATASAEHVVADDAPVAPDVTAILGVTNNIPLGTSTNVVIILDISGSMNTNDGKGTRLAIAKDAIFQMLDAYESIANSTGSVNVKLTTFSSTATAYSWMNITDAKAAVNALASGGYTNYEDALYKTYSGYTNPTADQTIAFFISDGEPTKENLEGRDVNGNVGLDAEDGWIDSTYKTAWNTFASTNFTELNVIGIGTGITNTTYLDKVAEGIQDATTEVNTMLLKDATELANMLKPNINVVTEGTTENVLYGADGIGGVVSIVVNTQTYEASNSADVDALNDGVDTGNGGKLVFDFTTGEYTYTTTEYVAADYKESFAITVKDADAVDPETDTFDLSILVYKSLTSHVYSGVLDAGDGLDTLVLGNGINIDFSSIADDHIKNIEFIDLSQNGNHTLNNLTLSDVLGLTDSNKSLYIFGDSSLDVVTLKDTSGATWSQSTGTTTYEGHVFDIYGNSGDPTVKVYVESAINESIVS